MLCQCVGAHEGGYVVDGLVGFPWGCGVGRDFWPKQVNVCLPLNKSRYCLLFSLRAWRETKVGTCSWSFGLPWGGCSYVLITAGEQSMHPMGPRWEVLPWALNIHSDLRVLCSHNPNIKLLFFFFCCCWMLPFTMQTNCCWQSYCLWLGYSGDVSYRCLL